MRSRRRSRQALGPERSLYLFFLPLRSPSLPLLRRKATVICTMTEVKLQFKNTSFIADNI